MAREEVKDIDEVSERLRQQGRLPFRLRSSIVPLGRVDHKEREAFGLE